MSFALNEFGPEHCNNRSRVGTPVALVTVGLIMRGQSAVPWHPSHAASRLLLMVRSYLAKGLTAKTVIGMGGSFVQLEPLNPFRWPLIPAVIAWLQAAVGES